MTSDIQNYSFGENSFYQTNLKKFQTILEQYGYYFNFIELNYHNPLILTAKISKNIKKYTTIKESLVSSFDDFTLFCFDKNFMDSINNFKVITVNKFLNLRLSLHIDFDKNILSEEILVGYFHFKLSSFDDDMNYNHNLSYFIECDTEKFNRELQKINVSLLNFKLDNGLSIKPPQPIIKI